MRAGTSNAAEPSSWTGVSPNTTLTSHAAGLEVELLLHAAGVELVLVAHGVGVGVVRPAHVEVLGEYHAVQLLAERPKQPRPVITIRRARDRIKGKDYDNNPLNLFYQ